MFLGSSSPWRANQRTPSDTVNGRLATVNMPIPETDSRPVNDPLTIRLEGCTGWRGTVLELEGTVKRWDEARAEAERLEALIRRHGCNPYPRTSSAPREA